LGMWDLTLSPLRAGDGIKAQCLTQDFIRAHEPCESLAAVKQILHLAKSGGLHFQLGSCKEVG